MLAINKQGKTELQQREIRLPSLALTESTSLTTYDLAPGDDSVLGPDPNLLDESLVAEIPSASDSLSLSGVASTFLFYDFLPLN